MNTSPSSIPPKIRNEMNGLFHNIDRRSVIVFSVGCAVGLASILLYGTTKSFKYWMHYRKSLQANKGDSIISDSDVQHKLAIAKSIIDMSKFGMLSTVDLSNKNNSMEPCTRMMENFWEPPTNLSYYYIATNRKSRKWEQLEKNPNINVSFWDEKGQGYVVLYGKVSEVTDSAKKQQMFPKKWNSYLDGPHDSRFAIIRLNIERIELESLRFNVMSIGEEWKSIILTRLNDPRSDVASWKVEL